MPDFLWPQGLQHARLPCHLPTPGAFSNSCPLSKSVMPSNHLILCRPLLLLPSIFPGIRVFSNELALHIRWPKYWSISFSSSPSSEYSEPISFRIDWFDLLAVQGTARVFSNRIVQKHHSLALSVAYGPTLTAIHDYLKNRNFDYADLCSQSNVSVFLLHSRFVIAFLPRTKRLLFHGCSHHRQWFWSPRR